MKRYHSIKNVFVRDDKGKIIRGRYSTPEIEYLANNLWVGTEKVNGTNIRVLWDGSNAEFRGRTDATDVPASLMPILREKFSTSKLRRALGETPTCLYGEGYGYSIHKGEKYLEKSVDFILFDILIGTYWLKRDDLIELASKLDVQHCPIVYVGTLAGAIEEVSAGIHSLAALCSHDLIAEGLVLTPVIQLFDRQGKRVIVKIKSRDFYSKEM